MRAEVLVILRKRVDERLCPADRRIQKFLDDYFGELREKREFELSDFVRLFGVAGHSLLVRPLVCPEVVGVTPKKTMEIRVFAAADFAHHLDGVASLFGDAGDPFLPEKDAALDVDHWTGQTGCVILAGGKPFQVTYQDHRGVRVTVISDPDFDAVKKEVAAQIRYAALLYGLVALDDANKFQVSIVLPRERVKYLYPDAGDGCASVKIAASGVGDSISAQQAPESFIDFICQATDEEEGPLAIPHLNNALTASILTETFSIDRTQSTVRRQKEGAERYLKNESVARTIPPLNALLSMMVHGGVHQKEKFARENVLQSDWYQEQLKAKQSRYLVLWREHLRNLESFLAQNPDDKIVKQLNIDRRLQVTREHLISVASPDYLERLVGTIGAQPL